MCEIKCIVCKGEHFRKGYYEIDVDIEIYSQVYNTVNDSSEDISVSNDVDYEISTKNDIELRLEREDKRKSNYYNIDDHSKVYKYICEDCGYIMSFTKEKNVESYKEEQERKKNENTYDWRSFK